MAKPKSAQGFLPDFCSNQNTLLIVLIAELLALILALSKAIDHGDFWLHLGLHSLFIQWLALGCTAALCWSRALLNRLSTVGVTLAVFALTQTIVLLFSLCALLALDYQLAGLQDQIISRSQFLISTLTISSIVVLLLLRYFYIHRQWQLNVEAQAEARLQALQARIRPHFLFNSLNNITSLIPEQPEQAENAILDLSELLRSALKQDSLTTLGEELKLCQNYLELEKLRMGGRLKIKWDVDEQLSLDIKIPSLILQPILENAVVHGIAQLPEGGMIDIAVQRKKNKLQISVTNPLPPKNTKKYSGSGIALDNIHRRLLLLYGEQAGLKINPAYDKFNVRIAIPLRQSEE